MFVATIESFFFALNAVLLFEHFHILDIGGAMTIHMFGAFFGLSATYFFQPSRANKDSRSLAGNTYISNLIAFIGALFLFIYWPSFNAVLASGMARHRAVVNTVLSITGSALSSTFVVRYMERKLDAEVLLNSALAGGVMMGAACDIIVSPGLCMLAGAIAGIISAMGFMKGQALIREKINLQDTCGVLWLHGIPGLLGSIVACVAVGASEYNFENELNITHMWPKYGERSTGLGFSYQCAGILLTLAISIPTGALTGWLASKLLDYPELQFDDQSLFQHVNYGDDCTELNVKNEETTH